MRSAIIAEEEPGASDTRGVVERSAVQRWTEVPRNVGPSKHAAARCEEALRGEAATLVQLPYNQRAMQTRIGGGLERAPAL